MTLKNYYYDKTGNHYTIQGGLTMRKQLTTILAILDSDLDKHKILLIEAQGGDPGHDIGDAGFALEVLQNMITESIFGDALTVISKISEITKFTPLQVFQAMVYLANLSEDQFIELFKSLYPGELAYSGFLDLNQKPL